MAFKLKNPSPFNLINEGPGDKTKNSTPINTDTKSVNKINEWNKSRLKTGRFDDQLGNRKREEQYKNMLTTKMVSRDEYVKDIDPDLALLKNVAGAYSPEDHAMFSDPSLIDKLKSKLLNRGGNVLHETAHSARALPQVNKISKLVKPHVTDDYLNDPEELYSRLMELRLDNNVDPNKVWGKKDMPNLRKMSKRDLYFLNHLEDNQLLDLMNKVAVNNKKTNNKNIV